MLLKKLHNPTMRNLLLRISILPVALILILVITIILISSIYIQRQTVESVRQSGQELMADTASLLKQAGEKTIMEHTAAIVKQAELFMKLNPAMTQRGLQRNRKFRQLVLRKRGETGYSFAVDMKERRILLHSIREFEGSLLEDYTGDLEEYIAADREENFLSGYFWGKQGESEKSEKRREYMYLMKVPRLTSDGEAIGIAFTMRYSEFIKSLTHANVRVEKKIDKVLHSIRHSLIVTLLILMGTILAGFVAALVHYSVQVRRIYWPIGSLLDGTRHVKNGNLNHRIYIGEPVEFNMLATSFNQMTDELKGHREELEKKVKKRTEQIELSEQKYRNLVESTKDIVFSLNEDFDFLTVNASIRQQLGFDPGEIIGTSLTRLIHSASEKEAQIDQSILMDKLRSLNRSENTITIKTLFRQKYSHEPRELRLRLEYLETNLGVEILGKASSVTADSLQELLTGESQSYVTNNYLVNAENISQRITRNLIKFVDRSIAVSIRISVREMIINAIEHGNLQISYNEKTEAQQKGVYMQLLNERLENPLFKDRKVEVDYALSQFEFSVRIRDEGNGFDYKKIVKQGLESVNRNMMMHGRGVAMALATFDRVVYNRRGNEVFLVKHIKE